MKNVAQDKKSIHWKKCKIMDFNIIKATGLLQGMRKLAFVLFVSYK